MKLFKKNSKKNTGLLHATTLRAYTDQFKAKAEYAHRQKSIDWVEKKLSPYLTTLAKAGADAHECIIPDDIDREVVIPMLRAKDYVVDYFGENKISIYW